MDIAFIHLFHDEGEGKRQIERKEEGEGMKNNNNQRLCLSLAELPVSCIDAMKIRRHIYKGYFLFLFLMKIGETSYPYNHMPFTSSS